MHLYTRSSHILSLHSKTTKAYWANRLESMAQRQWLADEVMRRGIAFGLLIAALTGCEQRLSTTRSDSTALPSVSVAPLPPLVVPAHSPKPPVAKKQPTRPGWAPPATTDTVVVLNGQAFHLRLEAETDSTHRLSATYEPMPGHPERVHGYEGHYTLTLRNNQGGQVFRRRLRKAAFFKKAGADIVTESEAYVPELLGYSRPLGALIFTLDFMVPDSDVGAQVLLLLDMAGNVLRLSDGRGPGSGPECDPALSPGGRFLLTASEVLRPGLPPLRLEKPNADLVGASFLTDTTLLVVYAPGKSHVIRYRNGMEGYGRTPTPEQLRAPNAFVRHVRTGRVLSRFRYHGFYEEMGFTIPAYQLRATATHYLLDEKSGLYLLPLAGSSVPTELRFAAMARFSLPKKLAEFRFDLHSSSTSFAFYVDTSSVRPRIRYQQIEE